MEKDFHLVVSCGSKTLLGPLLLFYFFLLNQDAFSKK